MAKYGYKFKKKVVEVYLKREGGCHSLNGKYGELQHVSRWQQPRQFCHEKFIRTLKKYTMEQLIIAMKNLSLSLKEKSRFLEGNQSLNISVL